MAQWTACRPANQGSLVQFPVRANAWVAGQVPSRGHARDNHTLMFLSLSFCIPSPLFKTNKIFKKIRITFWKSHYGFLHLLSTCYILSTFYVFFYQTPQCHKKVTSQKKKQKLIRSTSAIFIQHLLYTRHFSRHWWYRSKQKRQSICFQKLAI